MRAQLFLKNVVGIVFVFRSIQRLSVDFCASLVVDIDCRMSCAFA